MNAGRYWMRLSRVRITAGQLIDAAGGEVAQAVLGVRRQALAPDSGPGRKTAAEPRSASPGAPR